MKKLQIGLGIVLLSAAIVLSIVSSMTGSKDSEILATYIAKSKAALAKNDASEALKYGRLAIEIAPKTKVAKACYEDAIKAKYSLSRTSTSHSVDNNDEEEGAMGC